jgi:hypothetical protein
MNNVRLVCGGVSVDLPSDFGILINKSIADIREPESRSSDWSKTFTLPGTKANNKLFTHLFDLNLSIRNTSATNFNPDFNPNLKADAILQVDEVTQIQGFIRLLGIKINDFNQIEYECSMHGELADLTAKIADGKLSDLDFTEYNHIMNDTNIFNSWDTSIIKNSSGFVNFSGGSPIGDGYVYTWLDNGKYANYSNLQTDDMSICLYAKTVVDKIFSGAGYTYSNGSFFNTALFKRLVIPCQTQFPVLPEAEIQSRQFLVQKSSGQTISIPQKITFQTEITDPSNQFNTTTSEFTVGKTGQYDLFVYNNSSLSVTGNTTLTSSFTFKCIYSIYSNGVRIAVRTGQGNYTLLSIGATATLTFDETILVGENLSLAAGDVVSILLDNIEVTPVGFNPQLITNYTGVTLNSFTQNAGSKFYNQIVDAPGYGNALDFVGFFNEETKQAEFLRWIFRMFNLYIEPTDIGNQLLILPRDEFYSNTVRDWTRKRDLSQPLDIIPMGELEASRYIFSHSEGDDNGNKEYKADYNRTYGDRHIYVQNDFVKDEKKIETGFGSSLLNSFSSDDKVLTYIDNGDLTSFNTGKIRILQYAALACNSYTVWNGKVRIFTGTSTNKTKYPYTGHLDNPTAPTSDINFGMPRFIGLAPGTEMTNNNLFNAYWSKYMHEITDKDSKIVKGSFYLTPADMEKLSFRDLYFFDGNYFRLNNIQDYDPINPSVNICEFLFLKTGPTFTATTGTVGGGGQQGGGQQTEFDPKNGANLPGKVIRDRGFQIGEFSDAGSGVMIGNILTNLGDRNAAFASSGTTFIGNDSIVIGEEPSRFVESNEIWLQGHLMTQENFTTNRIELTTATTVTADLYKDIYIMDCTANTTLNLPDATTCISKAYYVYKNTSAHSLTINPYEAQTIDDGATYVITGHYECVQIVSDGTQWRVISKK